MFCKYCGETMDPSQTKCRRCGWEKPAASNCGGYHDVIKDLNKRGVTDPQNPPQVYVTQKAPESKLWIFTAICAILLVVVLIMQINAMRKLNEVSSTVNGYDPCECPKAAEETVLDATGEETTGEETTGVGSSEEIADAEETADEDSVVGATSMLSCKECGQTIDKDGNGHAEDCGAL